MLRVPEVRREAVRRVLAAGSYRPLRAAFLLAVSASPAYENPRFCIGCLKHLYTAGIAPAAALLSPRYRLA
jgi:hypothetical protein